MKRETGWEFHPWLRVVGEWNKSSWQGQRYDAQQRRWNIKDTGNGEGGHLCRSRYQEGESGQKWKEDLKGHRIQRCLLKIMWGGVGRVLECSWFLVIPLGDAQRQFLTLLFWHPLSLNDITQQCSFWGMQMMTMCINIKSLYYIIMLLFIEPSLRAWQEIY